MSDEGTRGADRDRRVDEVLAGYLEAVAAGHVPDQCELLARHPDLTAELEAFFADDAALRRVAQLPAPSAALLPGGETTDATAAVDDPPFAKVSTFAPGAREVDTAATEADLARIASPQAREGIIGDYELLEVLGRGGMGVVYKARQRKLKRLVALKMILAGDHAGSQAVARFRTEAEAVARLQHANIVQVHEVGEHEGRPYLSLEYVEGGSLAQKLAGTPLPPRDAARLVETLARAMDYAHQHGIIHRDLKPANILLSFSREPPASAGPALAGGSRLNDVVPKIADFGLAKQLESDSGHTQTGAIVGTPSYMAPEQALGEGKTVGREADVYALGAILYECLTGRPPFKAATPLETAVQVTMDEPVPPARLQPKVPRDLETICMKCLEKPTWKRYHSALLLAEDLRRFQSGEPIKARPVGVGERAVKWARRRPAVASLLATIAGLTTAALVLLTLAWGHASAGWGKAEQDQRNTQGALQQVQQEKQQKEDALKQEKQLRREAEAAQKAEAAARQAEGEQRRKFQRLSAGLLLDRGTSVGEQNDARGLLWLTRALHVVGKEDADLERVARMNLAGWGGRAHHLRFILPRASFGVAYSPDGKTLLTWGYDGAQRWDAATGALLDELPYKIPVHQAAYSADGTTIATAGYDGTLRVWDAKTGKQRGAALKYEGTFRLLAFSPNGKLLALVNDDYVTRLWDVEKGQPIGEPMKHANGLRVLTFSPDSKTLLTASDDRTARLWDRAGQPIGKPMEHGGVIWCAAFSPDGKLIATGDADATARLWNATTAEAVGQPLKHPSHVLSLALFNYDIKTTLLLTGCSDGMARRWDVATGQQVGTPTPHPGPVTLVRRGLTYNSLDRAVRLWQTDYTTSNGVALPHQTSVIDLVPSPDGKTIATRCDRRIVRVWETATATPALTGVPGNSVTVLGPDGQTVVAWTPDGKKLQVWQVAAGQPPVLLGKPIGLKEYVHLMTLSRDGRTLLSRSNDNQRMMRLWDVETGAARGDIITAKALVSILSFTISDDGATILATGPGGSTLYDVATRKQRGKLMQHTPRVWCGAFSPDGKVAATGGGDGVVRLWDASTGEPLDRNMVHRGDVRSLAFSRDGKYLLTGSDDRTARLWYVDTGKPATPPLPHAGILVRVALSPDGKTLLTIGEDKRLQLWDAATAKPIGPSTVVTTLGVFSDDGKTFLACPGGVLRRGNVPQALEGNVERLTLWVQVLTGLELDEDGVISPLDAATWQERRQRLEKLGGPPAH